MKKTLTFILTSILIVFSLVFTACTPNSNNIYAGNYKEVSPPQFYTEQESKKPSNENKDAGIKFKISIFNSEISDIRIIKKEGVLDGTIVKSKDDGSIKAIINVTAKTTKTYDAYFQGELTTSTSIEEEKISYYIDGDNYYKKYSLKKVTPSNTTNDFYTEKLDRDDFIKEFEDYENSAPTTPDDEQLPKTEEEFIAFIEEVCTTRGYRISTDANNGYKVKIDVGDMDAFKDYTISSITSSYPTFYLEVDAFEIYLVYDKNNNFLAEKQSADISTCYSNSTIRAKVDSEIRAYNGDIKLPSDLSTYTPSN